MPLFNVTTVYFEANQLVAPFPNNLQNLDYLEELTIDVNDVTDILPDELCTKSTITPLFLKEDTANSPNIINSDVGEYEIPGCCEEVKVDAEIYLMRFAEYTFGMDGCEM